MTRSTRTVVVLLVASLSASVVFALLTLLFHDQVLAYQQARHPASAPASLSATLWTRPIPVFVVAVLYIWVIRQLIAGLARAYRRVRIVSIAGFVAVAWLLLSAEYPPWLRGVQVVQLAVLGALIVAVNRPSVRAAFPAVPDPRPRNRRAAWLLVLAAPLIAEVMLGNLPLTMLWVVLLFVPMYAGGALFIREVARRTGGSLLLMGVAYGLVEEGLALQSLTSPHLYGAAGWAPRLFGLNTAYTELNLVYHAVFSITIPIVLVELLFPAHGRKPYLRTGGLITSGVVALLGAALIRVSVPPSQDPGYTMPLPAALIIAAAAVLVAVAGARWRARPAADPLTPPRVPIVACALAVAAGAFLALIWPFAGAHQPLFTHGAWSLLPMAAAAALVGATLWTMRRWLASPHWTSRHLLAACVGALVGHSAFGLVSNADTGTDRLFLLAVIALTIAAGAVALHRMARPPARPPEAPALADH
ncbi:hypothetical protein [Actinoplanes sp. NPDC049265]|uniref:hypothetical protein n=1 Tax=Actinoplanes sp. NPDC049265 TaxID=3363902 RepID=UPI0037167415